MSDYRKLTEREQLEWLKKYLETLIENNKEELKLVKEKLRNIDERH